MKHTKGTHSRLWAEWCFLKACGRHYRTRLVILGVVVVIGTLLFRSDGDHTLAQAAFSTFSLIFGELPEEFPDPGKTAQRVLFFLLPLIGVTIIIEAIIDFALILRDRRRFERSWCLMLTKTFKDHIVLIGLGRLGLRTFLTLRQLGFSVVVIERDPENQFLDSVRRDGSPLLIGDARAEALLVDANIRKARSIVLATDDDLANLEAALDARQLNPTIRVVLRLFDQNLADKVRDGFNIHLAMSQSAISAPTFAACAVAPATVNSAIVGDRIVAMQRCLVRSGGPLCDLTVADFMRRYRLTVVEHRSAPGKVDLCPLPETIVRAGDGLMLQGPLEALESVRSLVIDADSEQAAAG